MRVYIRLKDEQQVNAKFGKRMNNVVKAAMRSKAEKLAKKLENWVRTRYLKGQMYKRKTGALARSVRTRVTATQSYVRIKLEAATPYAGILHDGGRIPPHEILARGKAMKFRMKARGKAVFATKVNHPGAVFKGKPFLAQALKDMTPEINLGLKEEMVKAIMKS